MGAGVLLDPDPQDGHEPVALLGWAVYDLVALVAEVAPVDVAHQLAFREVEPPCLSGSLLAVQGVVAGEQIGAILVHADAFPFGVLGQGAVKAARYP